MPSLSYLSLGLKYVGKTSHKELLSGHGDNIWFCHYSFIELNDTNKNEKK